MRRVGGARALATSALWRPSPQRARAAAALRPAASALTAGGGHRRSGSDKGLGAPAWAWAWAGAGAGASAGPSAALSSSAALSPLLLRAPATMSMSMTIRTPESGSPQSRGLATSLSLRSIRDNKGARKAKKRLGRGAGSGLGKTAGRGMKGQKARSGNKGLAKRGFEGGQTPFHLRVPKWGFTNANFKQELSELNVDKLQALIDAGRLDASKLITMKHLLDANAVGRIKHGVKLLGKNGTHLTTPVTIEVTRASKSAIEAVERTGGTVVCGWYNRINLKVLLKPHKFHPLRIPRRARPPVKKMPFYTSYDNRGYLSPEMQLKLRDMNLQLLDIPIDGETSVAPA